MEQRHFVSAWEYVTLINDEFIRDGVSPDLIQVMFPIMMERAESNFTAALLGTRESQLFSIEEMESIHDEAITEIVRINVSNLIDADMIRTVVDEDGDLAYQLTEFGKLVGESLTSASFN